MYDQTSFLEAAKESQRDLRVGMYVLCQDGSQGMVWGRVDGWDVGGYTVSMEGMDTRVIHERRLVRVHYTVDQLLARWREIASKLQAAGITTPDESDLRAALERGSRALRIPWISIAKELVGPVPLPYWEGHKTDEEKSEMAAWWLIFHVLFKQQ